MSEAAASTIPFQSSLPHEVPALFQNQNKVIHKINKVLGLTSHSGCLCAPTSSHFSSLVCLFHLGLLPRPVASLHSICHNPLNSYVVSATSQTPGSWKPLRLGSDALSVRAGVRFMRAGPHVQLVCRHSPPCSLCASMLGSGALTSLKRGAVRPCWKTWELQASRVGSCRHLGQLISRWLFLRTPSYR